MGKSKRSTRALLNEYIESTERAEKFRESEWYGIRSLLGYTWAIFLVLLGARESGKSYAVMDQFVRDWKYKKRPFT